MNRGKTIFPQIMGFLPKHKFRQCVDRYDGNHCVRPFTCFEQFLCMALPNSPTENACEQLNVVSVPLGKTFVLDLDETVCARVSFTIELWAFCLFPGFVLEEPRALNYTRCLTGDALIPEPDAIDIMDKGILSVYTAGTNLLISS